MNPPACAYCQKQYGFIDACQIVDSKGKHYLGHKECMDKLEQELKSEKKI